MSIITMDQKDFITLFNSLVRYLKRIHDKKFFVHLTPDCIRKRQGGGWQISGKSETSGSIHEDFRYFGATLHYLLTGKKPTIACLMDGYEQFSEETIST